MTSQLQLVNKPMVALRKQYESSWGLWKQRIQDLNSNPTFYLFWNLRETKYAPHIIKCILYIECWLVCLAQAEWWEDIAEQIKQTEPKKRESPIKVIMVYVLRCRSQKYLWEMSGAWTFRLHFLLFTMLSLCSDFLEDFLVNPNMQECVKLNL